jgi:hypothetical protein
LGYYYEGSILRWRHVLLDAEGDVFLCNLESLVHKSGLGTGYDVEDVAYEQLRMMLNPEMHSQSLMQDIAAKLNEVKSDFASVASRFQDDTVLEKMLEGDVQNVQEWVENLFPTCAELQDLSNKAFVLLYMLFQRGKDNITVSADSSASGPSTPALPITGHQHGSEPGAHKKQKNGPKRARTGESA